MTDGNYESDAELIDSIEFQNGVQGITVHRRKIYVVLENMPKVLVYNYDTLTHQTSISLASYDLGRINPYDIVANGNNIYVCDYQNSLIFQIQLPGNRVTKWPACGASKIQSLSITREGNVLLTCYKPSKLIVYTPEGKFVKEIVLEPNITNALHAVQADGEDRYFVSQGGLIPFSKHRVCLVDKNGSVLNSYGESHGSGKAQLDRPYHLALDKKGFVLVADFGNWRVILLNSNLDFIKKL